MNISQAARFTAISAKMLRYYEDIALIPKPMRSNAGYRKYTKQDLERLKFIAQSKQLGFSLEEIRVLLQLWQNEQRHSADVKVLAEHHLSQLQQKMLELQNRCEYLQCLINRCAGNDQPECAILNHIRDSN